MPLGRSPRLPLAEEQLSGGEELYQKGGAVRALAVASLVCTRAGRSERPKASAFPAGIQPPYPSTLLRGRRGDTHVAGSRVWPMARPDTGNTVRGSTVAAGIASYALPGG